MTCPGNHKQNGANAGARQHKPHKICGKCKALSLPPQSSAFFVCCQCFCLVPYGLPQRQQGRPTNERYYTEPIELG